MFTEQDSKNPFNSNLHDLICWLGSSVVLCGSVGMWLISRFCSHLLGRLCCCLWFGGYVNFVEILGLWLLASLALVGCSGRFVIACSGGLKLLGWVVVGGCWLWWVTGGGGGGCWPWVWWRKRERGKERSLMFIL